MAKKINPMMAVVGGLLAVLLLFSIISIVLYPGAPIELEGGHGDDGHGSDVADGHGSDNEQNTGDDSAAEDGQGSAGDSEGDTGDGAGDSNDNADNSTENNTDDNTAPEVVAAVGDTVSVQYVGKFENGTIFASTPSGVLPEPIVLGQNSIVKGFDAAVVGMKVNERKTVVIQPEDGYPHDSALVISFDRTQIVGVFGSVPAVGAKITFTSGTQTSSGTVLEVTNNAVLIDFNKEVAGKVLTYEITVTEILKSN